MNAPPDKQPAAETLDGAGIVNRWRGMNVKISRYLYQSPAAVAQLCEMIDSALRNQRERAAMITDDILPIGADDCYWCERVKKAVRIIREGK